MDLRDTLGALFAALPPEEPLSPDDPKYIAIHRDSALTAWDPVEQLARGIQFSGPRVKAGGHAKSGHIQLLCGSRHYGKSTELRRLQRILEANDVFDAVLVDALDYGGHWGDFSAAPKLSFLISDRLAAAFGQFISPESNAKALEALRSRISKVRRRPFKGLAKAKTLAEAHDLLRPFFGAWDGHSYPLPISINPDDASQFTPIFLETAQDLTRLLAAEGRHPVVLVDSLEHVMGGSFLLFSREWPLFQLDNLYLVLVANPVDAQWPANVYREVRWLEPMDAERQGQAITEKLRDAFPSWNDGLSPEDLLHIIQSSGGCLGDVFDVLRQLTFNARSLPATSQEVHQAIDELAGKRYRYLTYNQLSILDRLWTASQPVHDLEDLVEEPAGSDDETLHSHVAEDVTSPSLRSLTANGVILYRQDRGYFLHPWVAEHLEQHAPGRSSRAEPWASALPNQPLHLESIQIRQLRVFQDLQLALPESSDMQRGQWLVLLGDNGVGKTTLLRALAFALADQDVATALFQLNDPGAPFLRHGERRGQVDVRRSGHGQYRSEIERDATQAERLMPSRTTHPWPVFAYGCQRGTALGGAERDPTLLPVEGLQTLFDPNASLIHGGAWFKQLQLEAIQAGEDSPEQQLFEAVRQTLVSCLDGVDDIRVEHGKVWFFGPGIGRSPLPATSDGYVTTAGWLMDLMARWTDLAKRRGIRLRSDFAEQMVGLVLIDEIDLHLHPRWQTTIIRDIRKAFPRLSFVVTTHNPLTALGASKGEIHILRRDDHGQVDIVQHDIPKGLRADQVLTGAWYDLPSVVDLETQDLMEEHRQLLRLNTPQNNPRRLELEEILSQRLGRSDTSLERMVQGVAEDLLPKAGPLSTADEREDFRRQLLDAARARLHGRQTIDTMGLDRQSLEGSRRGKARFTYRLVARTKDAIRQQQHGRQREALEDLQILGDAGEVHAGMVRCIVYQELGLSWDELEASIRD